MSKIYDILGNLLTKAQENRKLFLNDVIKSSEAARNEINLQEQAEKEIIDLLPVEMANTEITKAFDTYYHGYNSAVKETRDMLEIPTESEDE